jgi:bacillithiol system protein YtxJ
MPVIQNVTSTEQLDRLLTASQRAPVWIFKHSLACGVSGHALSEFKSFIDALDADDPAHFALVEIQQTPGISEEVARRTGVRHESPQLIVLRDGAVVWEASHWAIKRKSLEKASDQHVNRAFGAEGEG